MTFVVEVGDIGRFESPRRLMAYISLVPGERSTGGTVWRGPITEMGNARLRHLLVESAWTYRHPPRIGKAKLAKLERVPPKVREIAWKAQIRLTARYRALTTRGKKTAVARLHGHRARARRPHVGRREGGAAGLTRRADAGATRMARARAGARPRQGNSRQTLCGRPVRRPM